MMQMMLLMVMLIACRLRCCGMPQRVLAEWHRDRSKPLHGEPYDHEAQD